MREASTETDGAAVSGLGDAVLSTLSSNSLCSASPGRLLDQPIGALETMQLCTRHSF